MIAKAQAISRKIALNATGFCAWARARLDDFMGARGGALLHVDPHDFVRTLRVLTARMLTKGGAGL